mgnify:CR=1 FL=1
MRKHILITNDFPPKIGGIQSYLWELWRRLPDKDFCVYTTPFSKDKEFDSKQPIKNHFYFRAWKTFKIEILYDLRQAL